MRVNKNDESSTLPSAYSMTLGLNADEVFSAEFYAEYQLICSESCGLHYNNHTEICFLSKDRCDRSNGHGP